MMPLSGPRSALRTLYRRLFKRAEDTRLSEVVATLRHAPLFAELSGSDLVELAEVMHQRAYRRDEFVYYEGDPGLGLYVVQRGGVVLLGEDADGSVHELRNVEEGEVFGELSLLGDFRRLETAQALTDTRVLGFFSPDLKTMLKRNPRASAAVLAAVARHLAAREVELLRQLSDAEGAIPARRLLSAATARAARAEAPLVS